MIKTKKADSQKQASLQLQWLYCIWCTTTVEVYQYLSLKSKDNQETIEP